MIEITLPWPLGLSPNRARRMPMASRTGHEADDRLKAKLLTLEQVVTVTFPAGELPLSLTAHPPYARHLDALSFHYMLKAQLDGVCDALGLDDWRLWPVSIYRGQPVAGGKVVVRIGSPTPDSLLS